MSDLDLYSLRKVGQLLTRVFPPCPNSIANLFLPSACFQLIQKNKFVSVWLSHWLMKGKSPSLSPCWIGFALIPFSWPFG